jgi:hypothetical protein
MKTLCVGISNRQKWFEITQPGIISHNKIFQTLFTHKLVQNKTNQLN